MADIAEFNLMCPYIDLIGAGIAKNPARMGPIMTHLPMSVFRPAEQAKYIYVARNPYDCAVSFYHFVKGFTPKTVPDVSFERFLSLFLDGKVVYGDYFDHLLPWYERRHDSNIYFSTYEKLQSDIKTEVLRISNFLGENHGALLRQDQVLLNRVVDTCSLESTKTLFNVNPEKRMKKTAALAFEIFVPFEVLERKRKEKVGMHEGAGFVRNGIVGDWRNYFTSNQIAKTKAWIEKITKGSDVMTLLKECGLP